MDKNVSGVYKILNITTDQIYVGSCVNFQKRIYGHLHALRKKKHHSYKLQKDFNKFGESDFIFILLAKCPVEYLIKLEQKFLDNLKPFYNISPTAQNCLGKKDTEETKLKKSLNNPRRNKFGEDSPTSKIIYQYDINGNFIKKWYGADEAARSDSSYYGGNIRKAARDGIMCYDYIWLYEYDGPKIETNKKRRKILRNVKISQYDLNNNFIKTFENIVEAANEFKKCPSSIRRCVQGKQETAYGFIWRIE